MDTHGQFTAKLLFTDAASILALAAVVAFTGGAIASVSGFAIGKSRYKTFPAFSSSPGLSASDL